MRFRKTISYEHRELLTKQLHEYRKEMPMTKTELKELEQWVSRGNSPYTNGSNVHTESGYDMDFISALRFIDDMNEWFNSLSDEEREEFLKHHYEGYNPETGKAFEDDWSDYDEDANPF